MVLGIFFAPLACSQSIAASQLNQLVAIAEQARDACASKIHFNTYEFQRCVDRLATQQNNSDFSRLAINYAGYAVALSTTRVGMEGAESTAWHFYKRYKPLQTKLNIDDQAICGIFPGNCKIRVAQTVELQKSHQKGLK